MALALERLLAFVLAVTVFAVAAGSTIENRVLLDARPARWDCLAVLMALSIVYAAVPRSLRLPLPFLGVASALAVVAFASTLWSVDAALTLKRAASFAALLLTAACLLYGSFGRPAAVRRLLAGLLGGAAAVAVAGLVVLAVDRSSAVQPSTTEYPARYRGFEQNPNTAAMLLAIATPLAALIALEGRSRVVRAGAVVILAVFAGSLAASGARGPVLAALIGTLVLVAARSGAPKRKLATGAAALLIFGACVAISQIPDAKPVPKGGSAKPAAYSTRRTLFTSSGRIGAWRGAIRQAAERPVAGYGFGTEELAFVNRYQGFVADLPENSYIGAALQLGVVGLALLLAAVGWAFVLFARGLQRLGEARGSAAACAGAVAAALTVAVTQSYLFSVGNLATASAWICVFLLAGTAAAATSSGHDARGA